MNALGKVGAVWGLAGVVLLLTTAVHRIFPAVREAFASPPLHWYHWLFLVASTVFLCYFKGYLVFQRKVAPRVAARSRYLREHPRLPHVLLAPFMCMGYFHATRRRRMTSIAISMGVVGVILVVRTIAQPWRGFLNVGVIIGLVWGAVSILLFGIRAWGKGEFGYSPETPDE